MLGAVQLHADGLGAKFRISASQQDSHGNPATIENVQVSAADPSFVTVEPTGVENEWKILQAGPVTPDGEVKNIDVTFDGRSGEGEVHVADFIAVTVVAGDVTTLSVTIDPEERA